MRASWVIVCAGLGCGETTPPNAPRPMPRPTYEDLLRLANGLVEATSKGDAAAIEGMLHAPVRYGGVWFDDADCRNQFASPGTLQQDQIHSFAACLAKLRLELSARHHALSDTAIVSYAPGIELEVAFVPLAKPPWIRSIGFVSRGTNDDAPTITPIALDSLRIDTGASQAIAGERLAADVATTGRDHSFAWLKLCVDGAGTVTVAPRDASSAIAEQVFTEIARSWKFRPMLLGGQPVPVCSIVRLVYPAGKAPAEQTIPISPDAFNSVEASAVEAQRVAGEKLIVPNDIDKSALADEAKGREAHAVGSFKLCLDDAGNVMSVKMLRTTGSRTTIARSCTQSKPRGGTARFWSTVSRIRSAPR